MKNFKALTLATIATLTTIAPAQAGFLAQDGTPLMDTTDFPATHATLVETIYNAGVPIVDGGKMELAQCLDTSKGYLMGFYQPSANIMVICTNNGDATSQAQTLTHEAMHLVQDAGHGLHNDDCETIGDWKALVPNLSAKHVSEIEQFYTQDQWGNEVEARTFENDPDRVAGMINKFVF
jgi:hypothetical protein